MSNLVNIVKLGKNCQIKTRSSNPAKLRKKWLLVLISARDTALALDGDLG